MANNNQIEKVYELKTIGADNAYNSLSRINNLFLEMAKNKQSLGSININIDASKVDSAAAAFDKLTETLKDMATIGQSMVNGLNEAFKRLDLTQAQTVAGFIKFQQSMATSAAGARAYSQEITTLGSRLAVLKDQAKATSEQIAILGNEYKENEISEEEYNTELARLTIQLSQTKTQINEVSGAMNKMNKVFNPGLLEEEQAALAADNLSLQQRNQLLKLQTVAENAAAGSISEARAEAALYRKELQDLNLTTDEGVAEQKRLIAAIDELDAYIKANSEAYTRQKINIGNYPELTIQAQTLKEKMDDLTASGQTETQVFKELEIEAIKVAAAMKAASSPSGGIGNITPTTSQQLSQLKVDMQGLVVAGKEDSAEFKAMEAEAQRLAAAVQEVNVSIKGATTTIDKFGSIVERMGLRMLANMLIFQTAMELITAIYKKLTNTDEASKKIAQELENQQNALLEVQDRTSKFRDDETNKTKLLFAEITNLNNSYASRIEALKQLIELYPTLLENMTAEEALAAGVNSKIGKSEQLKADIKNLELSIQEKQKELNVKEQDFQKAQQDNPTDYIFEYQNNKSKENIQAAATPVQELKAEISGLSDELIRANLALNKLLNPKHAGKWLDDLRKERDELEKKLGTTDYGNADKINPSYLALQKEIEKKDSEIKKLEPKKPRATKEPHDYTDQELAAKKKLYEEEAKLQESSIQDDQAALQQIYDSAENNLDLRLSAYKTYIDNKNKLIELSKQAEIQADIDKLKKITEIEKAVADHTNHHHLTPAELQMFDDRGALKPQEQNLLFNKRAIITDIAQAKESIITGIDQINAEAVNGVSSIVKTSFEKTISEIDSQLVENKRKIYKEYGDKQNKIIDSHIAPGVKGKALDKNENKQEEANDQQEIIADELKSNAIEDQIQIAHNDNQVILENKLREELLKVQEDYYKKKKDLADRQQDDKELETFQRRAEEMGQIVQSSANAYFELEEKQESYHQEMAERNLQWNEQLQGAEAQSNNQMLGEKKANMLAEQQLEKQKAQQDKERAEQQIIVNAVIAASKALVEHPGPLGIEEGLAIMVAAGIQEAFLATAPTYESGGWLLRGGDIGGNRHAQGGTPFAYGGRIHEAESGEISIINRRSSSSNDRLSVSGTPRQIASAVNAHGGGVDFSPGAKTFRFEYGGSLGNFIQPPTFFHPGSTSGDINSLHHTMQDIHLALMTHVAETSARVDRIQVQLNPTDVSNFQKNKIKNVKLGTL